MNYVSATSNDFSQVQKKRDIIVNELKSFQNLEQQNTDSDSITQNYSFKLYELEKNIADAQNSLSKEQMRESVIQKYLLNKPLSEEEVSLVPELKKEDIPPKSIDKIIEVIESNKKVLNGIVDKLKLDYENVLSVNSLSKIDDVSAKISEFSDINQLLYHNINSKRVKNLLA